MRSRERKKRKRDDGGGPNFLYSVYSVSGRFWEEGVKPIENNGQDAALWTQMSFIFN